MRPPSTVEQFLKLRRVAVIGASRRKTHPGRLIYQRLKSAGYEVYPINPAASDLEGDPCFDALGALPAAPEGVIFAAAPSVTSAAVDECVRLGVQGVWMHRSFGKGSVDADAATRLRDAGILVVEGGCPMMYVPPVDFGHRCIRFMLRWTGGLPR